MGRLLQCLLLPMAVALAVAHACAAACRAVLQAARRAAWIAADGVADALHNIFCRVAPPVLLRLFTLPEHIYFVMDGNRRWAKGRGMQSAAGHAAGYHTLQRLLRLISRLRVREVTVYAFSIPNFERSAAEKEFLFTLATRKLREMLQHGDIIEQYDLRVRVVGEKDRLPQELREAAEEVERATAHRTTCVLNIAFAYAARQEMLRAGCGGGEAADVGRRLWVPPPPPGSRPPLLIRTSGEQRFSDFLIWQTACGLLVFQKTLWPDYRPWHLAAALWRYSRSYRSIAAAQRRCEHLAQQPAAAACRGHRGAPQPPSAP
eukprot:TRINITY_DN47173_c0_g1_i1.p1 TRINITY_DN47173_c0_g1~~TRINITY_DN47173_c0_g1_i1.p1  ORF type:complete len:342 (+),score=125.67 TRINITY_DN47173_c0_g1_i1:75-1028(+)